MLKPFHLLQNFASKQNLNQPPYLLPALLPMKNGAKMKTFPSSVRQSWKSLEDDDEGEESDSGSILDSSFSYAIGIDPELLTDGSEYVSPLFMFAFMFISFGYMLPWTALGSLISYYKYTYSAHFYVKIYCAYYLPGLPISVLQYLFDEKIDAVYGSQNMFLARGIVGYAALAIILFSLLWVDGESMLVGLFALLGLVGWWLHGTASMLASMFPKVLIAYLQIGFRCPEIYAVTMDYFLSLDKDASQSNLNIFYKATTVAVLLSLSFWILVIGSGSATIYFSEKDDRIRNNEVMNNYKGSTPLPSQPVGREQYTQIDAADDWQTIRTSSCDEYEAVSLLNEKSPESTNILKSTLKTVFRVCCVIPAKWTGNLLQRGFAILYHNDAVFDAVCPLCLALLVTMWSSIFQASFFAYVESPKGRDIEQILYFTRLFSDLFGRPLTFLARPNFVKVIIIVISLRA